MSDRLILAVPSKGRLEEKSRAFFKTCGLTVTRDDARSYRGTMAAVKSVEVQYLSASKIANELFAGNIHLGITGLDLVCDTVPELISSVHLISPLGFGHADVVTAVPKAWIDVNDMQDLCDISADILQRHGRRMRVATKYMALTRQFFASHALIDYRLVESTGATEGAPGAGTADIIVDITSTGTTLAANDLKILSDGHMLSSQAYLVASPKCNWKNENLAAARTILDRISGQRLAENSHIVETPQGLTQIQAQRLNEAFHAQIISSASVNGLTRILCPQEFSGPCADYLRSLGSDHVVVSAASYIYDIANPLYEKLEHAIEVSSREL